jgi:hypothetical protein
MIRKISGITPSRQISLIYRRKHLKEGILSALENLIISSLPKNLLDLEDESKKIISPKFN